MTMFLFIMFMVLLVVKLTGAAFAWWIVFVPIGVILLWWISIALVLAGVFRMFDNGFKKRKF